ncbi:GNAT family N-acetyltransferase [Cyclobacterium amurskyense]|uniref:GCN5-related N-acetyltransferase n=1 Tax=Cyclobacterium amurskyense TaxID=320787 RepID=A0A0H4PPR7_9BACT|nr:GNAT family N-acetyltransferase [Cyclobacterium amurskyense]AKP50262.1 GCN5-related N-acetyltransferase [Cyclobacterium amurskyense]|tara:strand:+ start:81912 stop:82352 length:441 start_codon:yes stop_codon:yes gene_type:complete
MFTLETLSAIDNATYLQKLEIADFLFEHLDQYGDPKEDIMRCLDYALDQAGDKGGFSVMAREEGKLVGVVVVNKTGMSGYIPENILVYIAVDASQRGKGVGKKLMKTAIDMAQGDVALHVEPDNPAKFLYEKLGFENKYLEMRLKK